MGAGVGVGVGVGDAASSFVMVPVAATGDPSVAPVGVPSVTRKLSSISEVVSPVTITASAADIIPAGIVAVPDMVLKSALLAGFVPVPEIVHGTVTGFGATVFNDAENMAECVPEFPSSVLPPPMIVTVDKTHRGSKDSTATIGLLQRWYWRLRVRMLRRADRRELRK